MTHRQRAVPRPADVELTASAAGVHAEWCNTCKARSLLAGEIALLTPDGVATLGYWAWCPLCAPPGAAHARRPALEEHPRPSREDPDRG